MIDQIYSMLPEILGILSALGVLAVAVTAITKSKKDDEYALKYVGIIKKIKEMLGNKKK